jgi:tRNA/tmRNA/rRNA uracil-C5-methylase (TrmA/RlmC/RlmD family)
MTQPDAPEPPPSLGSILPVSIVDVAFGGKGVARVGGKAVFVPGVIVGETARVRIVADRKRFFEAELVEVVERSEHRVQPKCPLFGLCGGCTYQHIAYGHQLAIKARQVEETVRRIGGIDPVPMGEPIGAPEPYTYRNRIRVHAGNRAIGFFGIDRQTLVDVARCEIAAPEVNAHLERLRQSKRVQQGDYTLSARGHTGFFEQTNDRVAGLMLQKVGELLGDRRGVLVDAYCGAGFFGHGLAGRFDSVIGIEVNQRAVGEATKRAGSNERYREAAVDEVLAATLADHDRDATTLLLDPPAEGVSESVIAAIRDFRPAQVGYISCNPATLARDLSKLAGAYALATVIPADMFPQTAEIEVIVLLNRG